jgi:hypothetical protein
MTEPLPGAVRLASEISDFAVDVVKTLVVEVSNQSNQHWLGDILRPLSLSYHWLDIGNNHVVWDGERSAFPPQGIAPGQDLQLSMRVLAPKAPGEYKLVLSVVQERVGWFEQLSVLFTPACIAIQIMAEAST